MNIHAEKLDYLVIGHITRDLIDGSTVPGGTVVYSALCAHNLEQKTGVITACDAGCRPKSLEHIPVYRIPSYGTTTFENLETESGRKQILHKVAKPIGCEDLPALASPPKIVHLGPVADELDAGIVDIFPNSFIGITPQGWMRQKDKNDIVQYQEWKSADLLLPRADAVVLSIEDVQGDRKLIEQYAGKCKVLALTEGYHGALVYWNGDMRRFSAPSVPSTDATGAGDIFAAVFFSTLYRSNDPWASGKLAVSIASDSVSRVGIKGVPDADAMRALQIEII